jgi:hypothetical protein
VEIKRESNVRFFRMSHGVIDCNDDVLAVRRLRGAAFLPKVLALAFAVQIPLREREPARSG